MNHILKAMSLSVCLCLCFTFACDSGDGGVGNGGITDPQVEITEPAPLLNPDGTLAARGWARSALMEYNPETIQPSNTMRIKEWDHYTIQTPRFAMAITVSNIFKIITFASAELVDYYSGEVLTGFSLALGNGSILPLTPYDQTHYENRGAFMTFEFAENRRIITFHFDGTLFDPEWDCQVVLEEDPEGESIAVAAPFDTPDLFFYENKVFGMPASGELTVGGETYTFDPEDSFGILDWGRGVWPHENEWHWGAAAGYHDGGIIGFNLGDGYSDDSLGTVNGQLAGGRIHKLYYIDWDYSPDNLLHPWHITSDDGRFDVTLEPFFHQQAGVIIFDIGMTLDKMHGLYTGKMTLDDGTVIEFEDLLGFAEHSFQKW
ncbi:DUF2804 domain-containing protein [Thermodesulfobacteriota bacterium]